ncbi:RNA polymerase sigma-70 factor [Chitinophaga sp. 22620]|uniref:RNA polymerase sigma-70 factor n=1 Tax=Chitinophaga sp. 22620 TaxID=3453952 RepID=UPI003F8426F3
MAERKKIDEPASMDILELQQQVAIYRDENAYKRLFLHFYKGLIRFADTYVRQREVAEEIVSDVMLKIWTMQEALTGIRNLKVYLFKAVRNGAVNHLLKNRRYTTWDIDQLAPEIFVSAAGTPEDETIHRELKHRFAEAVSQLPPKCQMVYKLIRENNFSYREVAAILDISENTVDRHLSIAMQRLGAVLQTYRHTSG